jgi:hypothetical protein
MGSKKINQIALSIIILSVILVLIFIDKILINLTAAFMVVGIPTYYYFMDSPQLCIGLLMFFPALFYLNYFMNKNEKKIEAQYKDAYSSCVRENSIEELNAWHQEEKLRSAKQHLNYLFWLFTLTVPASFFLSLFFGLKKFSLAALSTDLLFTGWMGLCFAIIFGYGYRLTRDSNKKVLLYMIWFLLFAITGFVILGVLDSYIFRPDLRLD